MGGKKYLAVFAHPDDAEVRMGGTLLKLNQNGHEVKVLSLTNGNAGHHQMNAEDLAVRRAEEAKAAAEFAGVQYAIWDVPDGHLEVSLTLRERLMKEIRLFKPDVIFTFRSWDYHPDHRATAQLVLDAAYLITVPGYCPEIPVPHQKPVIYYTYDTFSAASPFRADTVICIDREVDAKAEMMAFHESQYFEWLPFDRGASMPVPSARGDRVQWLKETWLERNREVADRYRTLLCDRYGSRADEMRYAEAFELCEYGRQPLQSEWASILPD